MQNVSEIIKNHLAVRIFGVFEEIGARSVLAKSPQGLSLVELSEKLALNKKLLSVLCDYLRVNLPSVLREEKGKLMLGTDADNPIFRNVVHFSLAYEPVLTNMVQLLKGEIKYGKDVRRRSDHLQISSELYNSFAWNLVVDMLRASRPKIVVDLGCGSGRLLLRIKEALPETKVIGIEVDAEAARAAKIILAGKGEVFFADVREPEKWAGNIRSGASQPECTFVAITVWHELQPGGENDVKSLLKRYRAFFPGSEFYMVEVNGLSVKELALLSSPWREWVSLYQMLHPFTNQGMLSPSSIWQTILLGAGVKIKQEIFVKPNLTLFMAEF